MKTKRLITILSILLLAVIQVKAYEQRDLLQKAADLGKVKSSLLMNQKWVQSPAYTDRKGWDEFLGDYKNEFIQRGNDYLDYEWKIIKATDYLEFGRGGSRSVMEKPYWSNQGALKALFDAELAEGEGRFIDQIINGVFSFCEMTTWSLSAHLYIQKTDSVFPNYEEQVIDLGAAGIAAQLAWIYYYLKPEFDKVNPLISKRLRHELQVRILDTYMNEDHFWWMAFHLKPGGMVNNWNPACNRGVLQCFLLLENDRDKLAAAVYRTMVSIDKFINYNHDDGGCEEGSSYWGGAAGGLYAYLQLLSDATGGKISIFSHPILKNMGEFIARSYVGNGWIVNFADAGAKGGGNADLIFRYGKAVGSRMMQGYASFLRSKSSKEGLPGEALQVSQTLLLHKEMDQFGTDYEIPDYSWYPETEICYMKNKNGFFVAAKGGYNDESHNHNDVGTFSLYLNSTPIMIDAGCEAYTAKTFSSHRYEIWTMQSNYHNLPMINGIPQQYGAKYRAENVSFNPKKMIFSADIAHAYPMEAQVSRWIRSYKLEQNAVIIKDDFKLDGNGNPNRINFLTWGKVDVSVPGVVTIEVNKEKVRMTYDKNSFTASIETINLDKSSLSRIWGKQIYRVSLNAKKRLLSGSYIYKITK